MRKNNDSASSIIGFIIFTLFSLRELYTTIMSWTYSFSVYLHINYTGMVIWLILGLFMLYWCIYFFQRAVSTYKKFMILETVYTPVHSRKDP